MKLGRPLVLGGVIVLAGMVSSATIIGFLRLAGIPDPVPDGTQVLPVKVGHAVEVRWVAEGGPRELWLDLDLDEARGLEGPIRVYARGRAIRSGTFSSSWGKKGIVGSPVYIAHNWSSTPWGVSGQVYLWDLPEVPAGTPMSTSFDLRADKEAVVRKVELQVRPDGRW